VAAARVLPLLAAAFATGVALADAGRPGRGPALALGAHALAAALVLPRARPGLALAVAVCAGAAAHGARLEAAAGTTPAAPREVTVDATVGRVARWGVRTEIELRRVVEVAPRRGVLPGRVRLRLEPTPAPFARLEEVLPGTRIRARLRLRPVHGLRNPGGGDPEARARRRGIGAAARLSHPSLHAVLVHPGRLARAWHAARRRAQERLEARGEGGALVAALGLGEPGGLRRETRDALARLGLAHLLAVSGLHLALGAGLAFALARRVAAACPPLAARADPRRVALAAALAAAAGHAVLAGLGVPVRRAALLLAAAAWAAWRRRPAARAPALAAAALAVLAAEPAALFAPGAQLSFAATAALLGAAHLPPRAPERGRARRALAETAAATAAAMAATAPLAALHFGVAAPLGALANLLVLPVVGAALLPAALGATLLALLGAGGAAEAALDAAASAGAAFLGAAQALAAHAPARAGTSPAPWALVVAACALPPALRAPRPAARLAAAAAGSVLLALAPPSARPPAPPRLVALDVGAGDAVLVQGRGARVLVDGAAAIPDGPDLGARVVVPALRALGVSRLDLVVASHGDLDHRGGLPAVLDAFEVGALWVPRGAGREEGFAALRAAAARRGVPWRERGLGDPAVALGDLRVVPLWPPARGGPPGRNDRSLVVRVDAGPARVLLPGDLERAGEAALLAHVPPAALRADVLKLPHHGSATSSTPALLDAVRPRLAVASAPRFPRHPMPAPEVRRRLAARDVPLHWTGRDGAVRVGLRAGLPVRTERPPRARGPGVPPPVP
jgi:competence protein ComEC